MRRITLALAVFLLSVPMAFAQSVVQVPFDSAVLIWQAPVTGSPPTTYHVQCKVRDATTSLPVVDVPFPTVRLHISNVVSSPGKYECFVTASNAFGEGAASNVLPFDAGAVPGPPVNLSVGTE